MSANSEFIQSFAKGLLLIEAFAGKNTSLNISEAAKLTKMTRAAARRYLLTLLDLGYVTQIGNDFRLTPKVLRLSETYIASNPLAIDSQEILDELSKELNESTSIGVLDGNEVVFIARSTSKRILTIELGVGTRIPAYCSSMGRVILSGMDPTAMLELISQSELIQRTKFTLTKQNQLLGEIEKTKTQGYSLSDQEIELGLRSLSVPIINKSGKYVAALAISSQTARMDKEAMVESFLPKLLIASKKLSKMAPL